MLNLMFKIFSLLLVLQYFSLNSMPWAYQPCDIAQTTLFAHRNAWDIKKVMMHDGTLFLAKESNQTSQPLSSGLFFEHLYAQVALKVGIPAKMTYLFLNNDFIDCPKSPILQIILIREWIEGSLYHQEAIAKNSFLQLLHYRPYSDKSIAQGFNLRTFKGLSLEPGLSSIVALDTYLCFIDRYDENLIIQEHTQQIYPLDGEDMVNHPLAKYALITFKSLYDQHYIFTQAEIAAVKLYRTTLKNLTKLFKPQDLANFFETTFKELGIVVNEQHNHELYYEIAGYKRNFELNYLYTKKLIKKIDACLTFSQTSLYNYIDRK